MSTIENLLSQYEKLIKDQENELHEAREQFEDKVKFESSFELSKVQKMIYDSKVAEIHLIFKMKSELLKTKIKIF